MAVLLGFDCGGSSCRALALDETGKPLHHGQAGPANLLSTPQRVLRNQLCLASEDCPEPDIVCACFAGLVTKDERKYAEDLLRDIFPASLVRAEPDYFAAYMAAPEGTDVCVVAGTGSVICSRRNKQLAKSGGRGFLLGNEGSAFRYGQDALIYYLDHPKEASTTLREAVQKAFGTLEEPQIIVKVYKAPAPPSLLGRLAPVIAKDAKAGHEYALESLKRQTNALAKDTAKHIRQHFSDVQEPQVTLAGGMWEASSLFRDSFVTALCDQLPDHQPKVSRIKQPPVYGAALLAKELL